MDQKKNDLEDRFVDYTCTMMDIVEALPKTRAGVYIAEQLVRSSHAPAFNYNEVKRSVSRKEFIFKLGIVLSELKDCRTALKIISKKQMLKGSGKLTEVQDETEALIAILGKSISTAKKNTAAPAG